MATPSYSEAVQYGGGKVTYILHIAGMPWAVSTEYFDRGSLDLDAMFGTSSDTYGNDHADDVVLYPWLDRDSITPLSVKLEDTKAKINIGTWSAQIQDMDPGATWRHVNGDRTIFGLDGLSTNPDPRIDNGIYWARLASTLDRAGTTLSVTGDINGDLRASVNTNHTAGKCTYLWIGSECIATNSAPSAISTEGAWTVTIVRGVWRTKDQTHVVSPTEIAPIRVADAPLGGIAAGRACYLWAVDNTISDGTPVLIRHGRISSQVTWSDAAYRLTVEPWTSWLDCTVRPEPIKTHLRGYYLTRGGDGTTGVLTPDTNDDPYGTVPHMVIWEWVNGSADYLRRDIWLCDDKEGVFFETYQDLEDAMRAELAAASAGTSTLSDSLTWEYDIGPRGLWHMTESGSYDNALSFVAGPLPWLLGWCPPNAQRAGSWESVTRNGTFYLRNDILREGPGMGLSGTTVAGVANADYMRRVYPDKDGDWSDYNFDGGGYTPADEWTGPNHRAEYIYGYGWDDVSNNVDYDLPGSFGNIYCGQWATEFIWPGQPDNSQARLYLDWDADASSLGSSDEIAIGQFTKYLPGPDGPRRTRMEAGISSSDATDNYLVLDTTVPLDWDNLTSSYLSGASPTYDRKAGPVVLGQYLHYVRAWHDSELGGDPWLIQQTIAFTASKFSHIFRALLGEAITGINIPKSLQFDHVPDAITAGDFTATIDWDSFDVAAQKIVPQQVWRLVLDDELNLYDLFTNACATAGICPTFEYSDSDDQHVLRARPIGVVDATDAYYSGRWLTASIIEKDTHAELEASSGDLLQSVRAELHWDSLADKYMLKINATSEASKENTGNRSGEMKIADKLTFFPSTDLDSATFRNALISHFGSTILANSDSPMPSVRAKGTALAALLCAPGTVGLVTDGGLKNPFTGQYGVTAWPCLYTGLTSDLKDGSCTIDLRLSPKALLGWSPSLYIPADSSSVDGGNNVITVTATTDHRWTASAKRTDLSYFGNITRCPSLGTGYTEQDSTRYRVKVYEIHDDVDTGAKGQSVYSGDLYIDNIDVAAGTCRITDNDSGGAFAGYDSTAVHIVVFADYDATNLADEQRLWCYMGDVKKSLSDGVDTYTGHVWC